MFAINDQEALVHVKPAPLLDPLPEPANDYGSLVKEFEETAKELLAGVTDVLDEVVRDQETANKQYWKQDIRFFAAELTRLPWLLVNTSCPPKYEALGLFYHAWAVACGELASALRALVRKGDRRPVAIRLAYAHGSLDVVTNYTVARRSYLERLHGAAAL